MTEGEKEYADYVKSVAGSRVTMLSLFSGFTFSTITILLNQLPDPGSLTSQLTLLFLVVLFDLCLFLLAWQTAIVVATYNAHNVSNPPARANWELTIFNLLLMIVFFLWGWSVVLMFLLWNLYYLALVAGVLWVAVVVAAFAVIRMSLKHLGWSPTEELRKMRRGEFRETPAW